MFVTNIRKVVIVLVLAGLLFATGPEKMKTGLQNFHFDVKVSLFKFDKRMTNLKTPDVGLERAIPGRVGSGIGLMILNNIDSFRLSGAIKENEEFRQRFIEAAYPKLLIKESPYLLILENEIFPKNHEVIDGRNGIILARRLDAN